MINQSRRGFFKTVFTVGAALTATGMSKPRPAEAAAPKGAIKGICLFVPSLGKASEFVQMMKSSASGEWTAKPLPVEMMECYVATKELYEGAREKANTFVGVVDPATFAIVHEAIVDCGGSFHYTKYEERNRVTFSAQI